MSRGWWGWTGHETRRTAPVAPEQPQTDLPATPEPPQRLTAPQGAIRWLCVTPAGGKSDHPSEQAALNRAAMSTGSVVYPAVVEIEEEAS